MTQGGSAHHHEVGFCGCRTLRTTLVKPVILLLSPWHTSEVVQVHFSMGKRRYKFIQLNKYSDPRGGLGYSPALLPHLIQPPLLHLLPVPLCHHSPDIMPAFPGPGKIWWPSALTERLWPSHHLAGYQWCHKVLYNFFAKSVNQWNMYSASSAKEACIFLGNTDFLLRKVSWMDCLACMSFLSQSILGSKLALLSGIHISHWGRASQNTLLQLAESTP